MVEPTNQECGPHERLVRAMRAHWHRESMLRGEQNAIEAEREKRRGDGVFVGFVTDNRALLAKYARGYFGRDDEAVQDGVQELAVTLYKELRDLSETTHSRLWEDRFGFCLRAHAFRVFAGRLLRQYGKSRLRMDPAELESSGHYVEQPPSERQSHGTDLDPLESVPDRAASAVMEQLLESAELRALLDAIPDPIHREALILSSRGWGKDRIAQHMGCSVKTVYNRIEKATSFAFSWARLRYQTHGEFSDWIGR